MYTPESPQDERDEETKAREDASVSLVASLGGMALGTLCAFNTLQLAHDGWNLEGTSIVVSGLFAAGAALLAAREWVKFHRWRDEQLAA
ncbi:MAG TPA: hypothetical protein VK712_01090 [Verrucomicrobiae bacterium]|jgi:hypothetical protein|nr:hypothetical protein [Verrucomicrobiae bacterium]